MNKGRQRLRGPLRVYIVASALAATGLVAALIATTDLDIRVALAFGLLSFLAEQFPIRTTIGTTYSVTFVVTIATVITAGPAAATVTAIFGTLSLADVRNRPIHRHVFNAAQLVISAGVAGVVYDLVASSLDVSITQLSPQIVVPLVTAAVVNFLLNTTLVSGAVALSEGIRVRLVWRRGYLAVSRTYVAFVVMGFLLAVLYTEMGIGAVAFLLMPLLVARHAFQAAVSMEEAFESTVRSLIQALEAKDPYTSGHAGRVSQLSEMTARAFGLSPADQRRIRYAALMHDVGKLVVQNRVLQKPGKLTPEEYEHMKAHPVHGVEIVADIELLEEALVGVRHHHERVDGGGYPDGLAGDEIPLFARLIMVADAFDSMTSTRSYRKAKTIQEAFAEIHRCAGTQFDPRAIAALERAVAREGWQPHPETEELFPHPVPSTHKERSDEQVAAR